MDSLREETKALRQTVGLGSDGEVSGGVLHAPSIPQRAPSLMRSPTTQVPDGDLASALNDIKERLDGDVDTRRPGLPSHYDPGPAPYSPDNPGPEVAGLQTHSNMWVQFKDVVSYRAYRLNKIRANVRNSENRRIGKNVRRIKNLIPSLRNFDGSEPIALLIFLRTLQEGFNTLRAPEGTAVRTMTFLLRGDAKNFYEARSQSATQNKGNSTMSELTWPRMVHAFIARYLTDDHLSTAYESVTRILQQREETEDGFEQRIERKAADFCQVFKEHELVSYFIQGVLPRIRYTVAEQMNKFVEQERGSMLTARRGAAAEGRSVRARFGDPGGRMRPIRSRDTTNTGRTRWSSQNLVPTIHAGPGMDQCDIRGVPSSTTERTDRVVDF